MNKYKASACYDAAGWVHSIIRREEAIGEDPAEAPLSDELAETLSRLPIVAHYDGERVAVPHDDRRLWRAMRGSLTGSEISAARARVRELQQALPDVPADVVYPSRPLIMPADAPWHTFTEVPGLNMRAFTLDDVEAAVPLAVETALYPERCPTDPPCCHPPESHAWCALASRTDERNVWQLVLEFEGRPLQYEFISLDRTAPVATFTMHVNRERPHWFWREAERPVFSALRVRGYRHMLAHTRSDRPDWVEILKRNYKAVEIGQLERSTVLEFSLGAEIFEGWPERKQAPAPVPRVREGSEADFGAVAQLLERDLAPDTRAIMLRRMRESYHLDRASLLLFHDATGALQSARMVRPRRDTTASYMILSRAGMDAPTANALKTWVRSTGYTELTAFVDEKVVEHPLVKGELAALGLRTVARHARFRDAYTEVAVDV